MSNETATDENVASEEGESIRQVIAELKEDAEKLVIRIKHIRGRSKAVRFTRAECELLKAFNYAYDVKTRLNSASTLIPELRNAPEPRP